MKKKHLILLGLLGLVVALMPATAFASTSTVTQAKAHIPHILFQEGHNHNHNQPGNTSNAASAASTTVSSNNLIYNGGPVMGGTTNVYLVFWQPANLVSSSYQSTVQRYFNDVGSSALYQITRQYTDSGGNFPSGSRLAGTWTDNNPYPNYPNPTINTVFDTDIQAEVTRAQATNGWTSSINNIFFVFTQMNEDVCVKDSTGTVVACTPSAAYLQQNLPSYFCAYHNYFGTNTIYATIPYAASFGNGCNPEVKNATPLMGTRI